MLSPQPSSVAETIEIDLAGKYRVRISGGIDAQALRCVLDMLERRCSRFPLVCGSGWRSDERICGAA